MSMGGGGQSTTTTVQELSPEQRALIAPVIPIAKRFLAKPPKQYAGSGIAGFTPLQQQAQQMTMSAADQMLPTTSQTANRYNQAYGNTNFLAGGDVLRADSNPYLQGAIEAASRPTMDMFNQNILPGLQSESVASGAYGGTRKDIASGIAGQAAVREMGDIASRMSNENYQSGLGAMVAGQQNQANLLQNQSNILQQSLLPAQLKESVGMQQQMMEQQLLSEKVQKYINKQMIPFSAAQDVAAMAFGMPGGTTRSTGTQPGNPMMGMQMAGSALGMLPMLMMKGSDRRLKKNVRRCGTLADGLGLYRYNYRGDGSNNEYVGLMADEVEKLYPEAIGEVFGYKTVNYDMVPSWRIN
jgi:hypothetical protein